MNDDTDFSAMLDTFEDDENLARIHTYATVGQFIERRIARMKSKGCEGDLALSDMLAYCIQNVLDDLNPSGLEITPEEAEPVGARA